MNQSNRKKLRSATAGMTAVALLSTGTFAWNAFYQDALNETVGEGLEAAARLHDDFNGSNKDVYIENYSEVGEGGAVYARVRLDEYMEVGNGAGTGTATGDEPIVVIRGDKAKREDITPSLEDVTTWDTYLYESTSQGEDIRKYRDLEFGGSTIYMPTFNKNSDSLASDMNGTLAGPDGIKFEGDDEYKDYVEYTLDSDPVTQDAIYDMDDNDTDEGDASQEGTNHELLEETHVAKSTLESTVMTMEKWISEGSKVGPYWVYDTDGWAYWAQAIRPQTATGLLLTGIDEKKSPTGEWYYGINVVAEMATADDWGTQEESDGFYESGISSNALALLNGAVEYYELISAFDAVEIGTDTTVSLDGADWYVIEKTTYNGRDMVKIFASQNIYGTTYHQFNATADANAWTNSPLRNTTLPTWLGATDNLKDMVVYDHPDAAKSTYSPALSPTKAGTSYVDSIFLISQYEYENLLTSEQKKATYAWWLRTPGTTSGRVMCGYTNGTLFTAGNSTANTSGVRPALWIYL